MSVRRVVVFLQPLVLLALAVGPSAVPAPTSVTIGWIWDTCR